MGIIGCGRQHSNPASNAPSMPLEMERLDQALFSIDTNQIQDALLKMNPKYPFLRDVFVKQILALDSGSELKGLLSFLRTYRPIFNEANQLNAPLKAHPLLEELFKYTHFYFPQYKLPKKIIYFIGPLEGYGNAIGEDYMAIGLQMFLGANASWYQSEQIQKYYPSYISQNFTPNFIPITAAKNLIQDIAPNHGITKSLIVEMIELGKRQFVLKKLLPEMKEADLMGYTLSQYEAILKSEQDIWSYLLKMNLIYSKDPKVSNQMLGQAPFNIYFGNEIPGNIGLFLGYKIVHSYMEQQTNEDQLNLMSLLTMPAEKIFAESKYRP